MPLPISSGLFKAVPRNVIVLPVLFEDRVKAVIELARSVNLPLRTWRFLNNSLPASVSC